MIKEHAVSFMRRPKIIIFDLIFCYTEPQI